MTVTDLKDISAKKQLIKTDEHFDFPLSTSDIKKYKIKKDMELSNDVLEDIKTSTLYPCALNRSLYLLKAKEYTEHEIRQKLSNSFFPEEIISSVINELKNNRFLDDDRYVESYVSCHCESKSVQAVTSSLIMKGVNKEIIDEAVGAYLENNPDHETDLCKKMLERKYSGEKNGADFETVNKAKMFLARKGFSYATADSAVKEFFDI